jgi:hypothetical protein
MCFFVLIPMDLPVNVYGFFELVFVHRRQSWYKAVIPQVLVNVCNTQGQCM